MNATVGKFKAKAAARRYRHPSKALRVIAVAGPYGKTTTALLLSEVLQEAGYSVLAITNQGCRLNSERLDIRYDERAGSIQRLFSFGRKKKVDFVILEVTQAILDSHVLITTTLEMSIITASSSEANALYEQPVAYTVVPAGVDMEAMSVAPHQAISFGDDESADARIKTTKLYRKGTEIELVIDHQTTLNVATFLVGRANAYNVAAAIAAAYVLGVQIESFEEGVARLEYVPGNFEYLPTDRLYSVVVDAAHEARSLELVVADAKKLAKRRLLVVADESVADKYYSAIKSNSSAFTAVGAHDGPGVNAASDEQIASEVVLRGAKQEDTVLFIGTKYAERISENLSLAQQLVEGAGE